MKLSMSVMLGGVATAALTLGCSGSGAASGDAPPMKTGAAATAACGPDALIDDGEDQNNQVIVQKGRAGYWYTYVDDNKSTIEPTAGKLGGTFTMSPGGANGSQYAARMWGTLGPSGTVYCGMGMNFLDPKEPYDASMYGGVKFYARKGPGSTEKVRLKIPDVSTDPDAGKCKECYNDFGVTFPVTDAWTEYVLPFELAKQEPYWGDEFPRITPSKLYALQWQVNTNGAPYDIYVDDIAFVGCDSATGTPAAAPPPPAAPAPAAPAAAPADPAAPAAVPVE